MNQIIVSSVEQLRNVIRGKKFLLVRGSTYTQLRIKGFLDEFPHVEFSGFTSNPLYEQVCSGIALFNKENCELLVAVGGGSAIDVANCIKIFCQMDSRINYLEQNVFDSKIPLIAIPTTAGTGSESTCHAVIYYNGEKQSISHSTIIPEYVVLDASVLKGLPVYQKKCTMMDALCQAIESWWSVKSTDESKEYSKKAITAIKKYWEEYIFENTDISLDKIMKASNLAGHAINITATTAPHAMSYKITSLYGFPHGHAVSVCLPEVWAYMQEHLEECIDYRGELYLKRTLNEISSLIDINYFKLMLKRLELTVPVSGNRAPELKLLVQSVNPERLKNNPVSLNADVLEVLYRRIVKV